MLLLWFFLCCNKTGIRDTVHILLSGDDASYGCMMDGMEWVLNGRKTGLSGSIFLGCKLEKRFR